MVNRRDLGGASTTKFVRSNCVQKCDVSFESIIGSHFTSNFGRSRSTRLQGISKGVPKMGSAARRRPLPWAGVADP